jgi:hypothetical protein
MPVQAIDACQRVVGPAIQLAAAAVLEIQDRYPEVIRNEDLAIIVGERYAVGCGQRPVRPIGPNEPSCGVNRYTWLDTVSVNSTSAA